MVSSKLFLAGLWAVANALPLTGSSPDASAVAARQTLAGSDDTPDQVAIKELELRLEDLQNQDWKSPKDLQEIATIKQILYLVYHITSITAPDGTTTTITIGKRQTLAGSGDTDTQTAVKDLEKKLTALQNKANPTREEKYEIYVIKAVLKAVYGITDIEAPDGTTTTLVPGKAKRQVLGGSQDTPTQTAIKQIELRIIELQNDSHRTKAEESELAALKYVLYYVYHITSISAPDGTTTTLIPGKRQVLAGSGDTDTQTAIKEIEVRIEELQNQSYRTKAEEAELAGLKYVLFYVYHITSISAPDGTTTTLVPGKRQVLAGSGDTPDQVAIQAIELQVQDLQNTPNRTPQQNALLDALKKVLYYTYHITSITAPDGTTTTITIGKRQTLAGSGDTPSQAVLKQLELKLEALQKVKNPSASQKKQIAAIKAYLLHWGITSISAPDGTTTTLVPGKM